MPTTSKLQLYQQVHIMPHCPVIHFCQFNIGGEVVAHEGGEIHILTDGGPVFWPGEIHNTSEAYCSHKPLRETLGQALKSNYNRSEIH